MLIFYTKQANPPPTPMDSMFTTAWSYQPMRPEIPVACPPTTDLICRLNTLQSQKKQKLGAVSGFLVYTIYTTVKTPNHSTLDKMTIQAKMKR